MCGITATLGDVTGVKPRTLNHRGPDGYQSVSMGSCTLTFNRLAINDLSNSAMQPFRRNGYALVCNGEIYNHKDYETGKEKSASDCECLLYMIDRYGIYETCNRVRGVFAMVWTNGKHVLAARDPFGVRPLFYVRTPGGIAFASEVKALSLVHGKVKIFPPGHFYSSFVNDFVCYYNIYWHGVKSLSIRESFIEAVRRRIHNTDREVGFLLSGGLDSSLVAAVGGAKRTFSIGQADSPDVLAAQKVAKALGTDHTEVLFDFAEAVKMIPQVICSLESYDTTTVRASTPMWILCKWISENTNCKVLLSGEGSDEILGGYKYFKNAPTLEEFQMETIRRLRLLHQFDVLRADRCTAAFGLEVRVPFLDRDFVDDVVTLDPKVKMTPLEKQVLRDAFRDTLPPEIIDRPKDAFSDAVGYGWVDYVRNYAETIIPDQVFERIVFRCGGHNPPTTKEEAWYRQIFWEHFGNDKDHIITEIWRPKWTTITDPSARKL